MNPILYVALNVTNDEIYDIKTAYIKLNKNVIS